MCVFIRFAVSGGLWVFSQERRSKRQYVWFVFPLFSFYNNSMLFFWWSFGCFVFDLNGFNLYVNEMVMLWALGWSYWHVSVIITQFHEDFWLFCVKTMDVWRVQTRLQVLMIRSTFTLQKLWSTGVSLSLSLSVNPEEC